MKELCTAQEFWLMAGSNMAAYLFAVCAAWFGCEVSWIEKLRREAIGGDIKLYTEKGVAIPKYRRRRNWCILGAVISLFVFLYSLYPHLKLHLFS